MKESMILCLIRGREKFIKPLFDADKFKIVVDEDWEESIIDKCKPDLLLSVGESHHSVFSCFKKARSLGIPTLNLQDGIHEWRDIWEHDAYARGGKYFNRQFIIADKISCIGQLQADWFTAMGMVGQPEVIGMPWMEDCLRNRNTWKRKTGVKKILIMTANTPAFGPDQYEKVLRSIRDLKEFFEADTRVYPIWRLRGNLMKDLNLINADNKFEKESLQTIMPDIDCVICTPSTALLESMIVGIPTALIDYTNSPLFINSAWRITCKDQISQVINELLEPPENKLNFQENALNTMVYLKPQSDKRLVQLVRAMISYGLAAREKNEPLILPRNIVSQGTTEVSPARFDVKSLFPYHSVFHKDDLISLQVDNNNLIIENKELKNKLRAQWFYADFKNFIKKKLKSYRH